MRRRNSANKISSEEYRRWGSVGRRCCAAGDTAASPCQTKMADGKIPSAISDLLDHCGSNSHFWLLPPLDVSWSICVLVDVLEPGSPSTRPLCRLKKVTLPS